MATRWVVTAAAVLTLACEPAGGGEAVPAPGDTAPEEVRPGSEIPLAALDGRLHVPVRGPDGAELEFLLSTGSPATLLSASAARRLGVDAELSLGGHPVPPGHREVVPDERLAVGGRTFDGMVGPGFLNAFDVLVDLPGERLVLRLPGRSVSWEGVGLSDPVPLRVYHGIVLGLDVEVAGRRYPAMLDLGQPGLLVNERVLSEAGVADGGAVALRVAGATLDPAPLTLGDHPAIDRFSPNGDGFVLVGAPLALGCAVSVSWIHRELRTCVR